MAKGVVDQKNALTVGFWGLVNKIVCAIHFRQCLISGKENLPQTGPYLLIANHTSRWDPLVLMRLINARPANYMTHPNELRGLQGCVLRSVGAFPADPRFRLLEFVKEQLRRGEPIVMFPEGGIFKDGKMHSFKSGAARILLAAAEMGIKLPVIPVLINYNNKDEVDIVLSKPLCLNTAVLAKCNQASDAIRRLTDELYHKVCQQRDLLFLPRNVQPRILEDRKPMDPKRQDPKLENPIPENSRLEHQRLEHQRLEHQRLEHQRLEHQRLEHQRLENCKTEDRTVIPDFKPAEIKAAARKIS